MNSKSYYVNYSSYDRTDQGERDRCWSLLLINVKSNIITVIINILFSSSYFEL